MVRDHGLQAERHVTQVALGGQSLWQSDLAMGHAHLVELGKVQYISRDVRISSIRVFYRTCMLARSQPPIRCSALSSYTHTSSHTSRVCNYPLSEYYITGL